MAELQSRNQLVKQLQSNIDKRASQEEKRERSQHVIRETLHNLENKLVKFTKISEKNQGGLKDIVNSINEQYNLANQRSEPASQKQSANREKA